MELAETSFLPAERADHVTVLSQRDIAAASGFARFFGDYPEPALVLNRERQVVWANDAASRLAASVVGPARFQDPRPGELLGCVHSGEAPAGCGTSRSCSFCTVGRGFCAVIDSSVGDVPLAGSLRKECAIERATRGGKETLEFTLWLKRFDESGHEFLAFTMSDVSSVRRKAALERVFFHDILNTAAGIATWLELASEGAEDSPRFVANAAESARRLIEEIQSQRTISQAEDGDLVPAIGPSRPADVLEDTARFCKAFADNREIRIETDAAKGAPDIATDPVLLRRVLANLVKNAIEASKRGDTVRVSARPGSRGGAAFDVANNALLDDEQKARVFQRSFSTKGRDRGLGTWGSRLIAERYLGGSISFVSEAAVGTVFTVDLPPTAPDLRRG